MDTLYAGRKRATGPCIPYSPSKHPRLFMKRIALLLFAGLFGFATLQTATAQNEASHDVTIDVAGVNELSLNNDGDALNIDIGSNINSWVSGDGDVSYDVETNKSGQIIEANVSSSSFSNNGELSDVGLKVNASPPTNASGGETILTDVGDGGGTETVVSGITGVSENQLVLDYSAKVNEDVSPGEGGVTLTVTYTLTSSD